MSAQASRYEAMRAPQFAVAVLCMLLVVVGSNILVQVPLNDWLTWGGLSYPVAFLVTDVLNRRFGPSAARRVAWFGFAAALVVSFWVASPRIALASGLAYICAQLVDIQVFDRLRDQRWWRAPLISGVLGAVLDTAVFFSVAFAATGTPWLTWMAGDLAIAGGQHQHAGAVPRADVEPGQAGQRLKPGGEEAACGPPFVIRGRARLGVWHRADIIETDRYIPGANAQD